MRTSTAILSHAAVGTMQAAAMSGSLTQNPVIPWWGQLLIQLGLIFGQGVLANINSNTDQNGNKLPPAGK